MLCRVRCGELDPRNAADHIGAERHRLLHQFQRAWLANDTVLGECNDLQIDDAPEFVAEPDKRFHAFETRLAVNISKSANVQIAVKCRQRYGAAAIFDDPRFRVFFLDLAGEFDAGHRFAHRLALIGFKRFLLHHRQRPHLAQMQVRIDEKFGHKIAARIDLRFSPAVEIFTDGNDAAVLDADFGEPIAAPAQPSAADGDIKRLIHGSISGQGCGGARLSAKPIDTPAGQSKTTRLSRKRHRNTRRLCYGWVKYSPCSENVTKSC